MNVLIAEDDAISSRVLDATLKKWGYEVLAHNDGTSAWETIRGSAQPPRLLILDWMMPGMDGPDICRKLRETEQNISPYLVLLTSKEDSQSVVEGLKAGADDYVTKPFDAAVLRARVDVGLRVLRLQQKLSARVTELEIALANVKRLQGLLPICSYCKRIRDDGNYWKQVDTYLAENTEAKLSHGFCPDCFEVHVRPQIDALEADVVESK
jgi:DNA-binding response OmpR family regulator